MVVGGFTPLCIRRIRPGFIEGQALHDLSASFGVTLRLFKFNNTCPLDSGPMRWSCNPPSLRNRHAGFRPLRSLAACGPRLGKGSCSPEPVSHFLLVYSSISGRIAISNDLVISQGLHGSNGSVGTRSGGVRWGGGRVHTIRHEGIRARSFMGV